MDNQIALRNIYSDLPSIETERLILRKLRLEDAADMFAYASDSEISRFRSWPTHLSIDDSRVFIAAMLTNYSAGLLADWGINHRMDQALIGTIGIQCIQDGYIADLGFVLSGSYSDVGLDLEAVNSVIEFGFTHLGFHRIQSTARLDDHRLHQVLESAGLEFEGILRDYRYQKGRFLSVRMYALLRQNYTTLLSLR